MKETTLMDNQRKKSWIHSLVPRLVCEALLVLLIFVPILLFVLNWSSIKGVIQGKVLSVRDFSLIV
jgi:hypothetical protein